MIHHSSLRNLFVLLCVFGTALPGFASQESVGTIERVSLEQGVSHNLIYAILQDSRGFMWFGTMYGLVRYDGYEYRFLRHDPSDSNSLSNDDIISLHEDMKGNLWIATYGGGVNKLNTATGTVTRYPSGPGGVSAGIIWAITESPDGSMWFGTQGGGLNKLDVVTNVITRYLHDSTDEKSLSHNFVQALVAQNDGTLWVGTMGGGLDLFDPRTGEFQHRRWNPKDTTSIGSDYIRSIHRDAAGKLWVGTIRGGLNLFLPEQDRFVRYVDEPSNKNSLSASAIISMEDGPEGSLWVGTPRGLNLFHPESNRSVRLTHEDDDVATISSNNVIALCRDRSGILWIGSYLGGLDRLLPDNRRFTHLAHHPNHSRSLLDNETLSMMVTSDGVLWVGTRTGLHRYDAEREEFDRYQRTQGKNNHAVSITSLAEDKSGRFWVGSPQGLFVFDRAKGAFHTPANTGIDARILHGTISSIMVDRSDNLWVGTPSGALRVDQQTNERKLFQHEPGNPRSLRDNYILSLYQDHNGDVWIGTYGGWHRYDRKSESFISYTQNLKTSGSLSNNYVLSALEDSNGRFWIGTGGGLNLFNRKSGTFKSFSEKDGLPNSVISSIVEDKSGFLWIATNKGLSRLDAEKMSFWNFDVTDGLQSNMFNQNAAAKLPNGSIAMGGIGGVTLFRPSRVIRSSYVPQVAISSVQLGFAEERIFVDSYPTLNYDQNSISFTFASLDFHSQQNIRYAYRLDNVDEDWRDGGERRYVTYPDLNSGDYVFHVKATNSDGVWNPLPTSMSFTVRPPFWRTWWFLGISLVFGGGLAYATHTLRMRARVQRVEEINTARRQEAEKVRKRAANDFHDELGHRLTKVALFGELVKQQLTNVPPEISEYLDRMVDGCRSLTNDTRDFIWTLDPSRDSLLDVMDHLKEFGEDVFDRTGIVFRVEGIDGELQGIKLTMETRRHLTLIFKEAIHNVLKHADCRTVVLGVHLSNGDFHIQVSDDGRGYVKPNGSGNGLKNMRNRSERIRGRIRFVSTPGKGSTIELTAKAEG